MNKNPQVPLTRTWLESKSTGELVKLADNFGIDIPHGLERIFIIQELLECSNTDDHEIKDDLINDPACSETAALPKKYNISYIEVIIRDPLWIFVYWEIKSYDREIHEKADDFKGYCLRLVPLSEGEVDSKLKREPFIVPVDKEDCARYIGLAEHSSQTQGRYLIRLDVIRGDSELQIAVSQPFCMPRLIENENINSMKENPLVHLSAVEDLSMIKRTDRQFRIKRQ